MMSKLFQQLLQMKDEDKINTLKGLIREMAEKATDEEYLNLCKTNLKLASTLPDDVLKAFIQLRMQASSQLPKDLHDRDMKLLTKALGEVDTQIREKISRNMPK
ncbi:MAG: dehydrogenase [Acidianus sp.]